MKDFVGSFGDGVGEFARAFLFPSVVAVALWWFFILDVAEGADGTVYERLASIPDGERLLVLAGVSLGVASLLGVLTPASTRILEGYWWGRQHQGGPLLSMWTWRQAAHDRRRRKIIDSINEFDGDGRGSAAEAARLSQLFSRFSRYPVYPEPVMPTLLGNVLKSGELFGSRIFGIDTISLWDQLIAFVPEQLANEVSRRRNQLDMFVSVAVLPAIFLLSTIHPIVRTALEWETVVLVAAIGWVVAVSAYYAAVEAARSYADAVVAVVQVGRKPLADALGCNLPSSLTTSVHFGKPFPESRSGD